MKEKTDQVILDSLKYFKRMLINMINIVLIVIGSVLILIPLFIAGGNGYRVLGVALVLLALLRVYFNKRGISIKKSNKAIYGIAALPFTAALLCQVAALILETLPYGVVMIFSSGPNKRITETFSYFSLTPFGYANFFPLPTGILTIIVIVLCAVTLIKKIRATKLQNAAFMCSIIAIIMSIMPLLLLGKEYMSAANYIISALMLTSIILQTLANSHNESALKSTHF